MRELLFRGKSVMEKWVEGSYYKQEEYYGDKTDCHIIITSKDSLGNDFALDYAVCDPETIGQFTGLTDKNGKKIFEGDILSERPPMNQTAYIGYVAYDEESAVWRFMIKNDTKYNGVLLGSYSNSYKVIGNIHDNPEFLKEGVEE